MPSLDYFALTVPDCGPIVELSNLLRTSTYIVNGVRPDTFTNVKVCGCESLPDLLGDLCGGVGEPPPAGYTLPAFDNAPWYDPDVPESAAFAGFLVDTVEGLDAGSFRRNVTSVAAGGAALGPLAGNQREFELEGVMVGASCCAVAYGMRWLARAAAAACRDVSHCESDLAFLEGCPDPSVNLGCNSPVTVNETTRSPWRTVTNVGLLDGPTVIERYGRNCGSCGCSPHMRVSIRFVAGLPSILSVPFDVVNPPVALAPNEDPNACEDLVWLCGPPPECETIDLVYDEACGFLPPPPTPRPTATCFCDPLAIDRQTVTIPLGVVTSWESAALKVVVAAGAEPIRNLAVRLYRQEGGDCGDEGAPPCGETMAALGISYVPPLATLTVDSARRRSYIDTALGERYSASRFVFPASGAGMQWLDVPCGGGPHCVVIEADAFNRSDGSLIEVTGVGRVA